MDRWVGRWVDGLGDIIDVCIAGWLDRWFELVGECTDGWIAGLTGGCWRF